MRSLPLRFGCAALAVGLIATACSDGSGNGDDVADNATESGTDPPTASAGDVDLTNLPIGDAVSSSPEVGAVYSCQTRFGGGGASATGGWIHDDGTWSLPDKPTVDGEETWPSVFDVTVEGATRRIVGNGLPDHPTGDYPIAESDDAYQFDRNPNSIAAQDLSVEVPAVPQVAAEPTCLDLGMIGVLLTGSAVFNALDAGGRDAPAYEIQDRCDGHPEMGGQYHYHSVSPCVSDPGDGHSELVGYAIDGFGIYGHRGVDGDVLTNAELDECHGHTHEVDWDGEAAALYHYHATWEYPYTLGCLRGAPVT